VTITEALCKWCRWKTQRELDTQSMPLQITPKKISATYFQNGYHTVSVQAARYTNKQTYQIERYILTATAGTEIRG
jgi:hypothetical protein